MMPPAEASVVGAGPNGLAAAIRLASAGLRVSLYEQAPEIGGGLRSDTTSLPGYVIDHCASVFPLAVASPFLSTLPLAASGVSWLHPDIPLAHPLPGNRAVLLHHSLDRTAAALGADGPAWRRTFSPLLDRAPDLIDAILGPPRPGRAPLTVARFGLLGSLPATRLARSAFADEPARALFCGLAAHSFLDLDQPLSAAVGLVLGLLAHHTGWPMVAGGSYRLATALGGILGTLGGSITTGSRIDDLAALPGNGPLLLDLDPGQAARLCERHGLARAARRLRRRRPGPGSFKIDYVLDGPVPWLAPGCEQAGTLHLGGDWREIAQSEAAVVAGKCPERPFLIAGQPSRVDPTRAPEGRTVFWVYCHVPRGAEFDMTGRIEAQIERFAPGFRDRIIHRLVTNPDGFERFNPAFPGGAIGGAIPTPGTILAGANPVVCPYDSGGGKVYLCSAYTPPGGGVHGMSGFHAANAALRRTPSR